MCTYWYAVLSDPDDTDLSYGSYDSWEALNMLSDYPDGLIETIQEAYTDDAGIQHEAVCISKSWYDEVWTHSGMEILYNYDADFAAIWTGHGVLHFEGDDSDEMPDTCENRLAVFTRTMLAAQNWCAEIIKGQEEANHDLLESLRVINCIDCFYRWNDKTNQYEPIVDNT